MTTEYTKNFRLNLPDFRMGPWHDLVNQDFITIDELMMSVIQGVDTRPWTNNYDFVVGMTAIDTADNTFWVCSVSHTSAPEPTTFAQDRAAHPTYWARVVVGIAPRGEWKNSTHYLPNDMVSDSNEGVIAICATEHTSSPVPATIKTDKIYWSFIADMGAGGNAAGIIYDNSESGVPPNNVQDALDLTFANDAANTAQIAINVTDIDNLETRVTSTETVNTAQTSQITLNTADITALDTRVDTIEGAGYLTDAPADGLIYARKDHLWTKIDTASVLVSDTAPVGAARNALWFDSNAGLMYINYWDGDSAQWVVVPPNTSASALGAVAYTAQTVTAAQQTVARQNIYAAPFDAMSYSGIQINGSMDVSQELGATGFTIVSAAQPKYFCDGWLARGAGTYVATAMALPLTQVPGFTNWARLWVTTPGTLAAGDYLDIIHRVEGIRIARLAWGTANAQPITFGFWSNHTATGIHSLSVRNITNDRSYVATYTHNVSVVPQYNVITIPGCTDGAWPNDNTVAMSINFTAANNNASLITSSPNTWQVGNFTAASTQVNSVAATGGFFRITGVTIIPGIEAPSAIRSPLIMRPYDQELTTCQRYWTYFGGGVSASLLIQGYQVGGNSFATTFQFPVTMRSAPSMSTTGTFTAVNTGPVYFYSDVTGVAVQLTPPVTGACNWYSNVGRLTADARL